MSRVAESTWLPLVLASILLLIGAFALAATAPASFQHGMLVDSSGRSLYSYDRDRTPGASVCNDAPCVSIWPPYVAAAEAQPTAGFSVFRRGDGSMQWAYKGKPLYRYVADQKDGDVEGDGVDGIWHVIRK
jgi:predicted lipoprotein with Yx(FWY)xxD motif